MQVKLISVIAALGIVLGSLGASAAGAASGCAESRACQPIGDRADSQKPRAKASGVKLTPRVDSGGQLWRAGNHIMY